MGRFLEWVCEAETITQVMGRYCLAVMLIYIPILIIRHFPGD